MRERQHACVDNAEPLLTIRADITCHFSILARLREEGWRDELDKIGAKDLERLFELEEVSRAVKLTEKGK